MAERLIAADRSIIVGADLEPEDYEVLMPKLNGIEGLSAVKLGFEVGLGMSLRVSRDVAKRAMGDDFVVIYDHQKAGTDIPQTGANFARTMKRGMVDAAIIFPFTGPLVQRDWTRALQDAGIAVIVGSEMTHDEFLESDGGRIADNQLLNMFGQAVSEGVRNFVVPGNKPERVSFYRNYLEQESGEAVTLYAPGFVRQGGSISEAGAAAGDFWHGIVATAIITAEDPAAAARQQVQAIL